MSNLAFESATSLAEKVRSKEISAVELLGLYLQRLEQFNPAVNAIIFTQLEKAQHRAQEADAALARGEIWGPLHGVPMTVKDSFDWVGSPTTWGNPELADYYPDKNDVVVNRLQDAGAVIFGKSNIPFMLSDWQSFNDIYGTTSNPWDLECVAGGSSGGSAAALAAGLTGLELGSDIGASIRNPAHYCGVYGHKPTYGIIPAGHMLPGTYTPADIAVSGPLARSADDLAMAVDVLAGPSGLDASGWRLDLPEPRKKQLSEYKVAVMLTSPCCAQDDELTEQLQKTVDALAEAGVQVDDGARPDIDLERAHHVYLMLLRSATGVELDDATFAEHAARMDQHAHDDWSYRAYVDRAVTQDHRAWWQFHNEREKMRLIWSEFFQEYDLLLCPTAASAAYPHDHEGERADRTIPVNGGQEPTVDQLFWAGLSCNVYLPSTVAPAGLTKSGLPCGLQIVGDYLQDKTCIEFARLIEEVVGGFRPPPCYI